MFVRPVPPQPALRRPARTVSAAHEKLVSQQAKRLGSLLLTTVMLILMMGAAGNASAQTSAQLGSDIPQDELRVGTPPETQDLVGKPLRKISLTRDGGPEEPVHFNWAPIGQPFSPGLARHAIRELLKSGRYADIVAYAELEDDGVHLSFKTVSRYVIAKVKVVGGLLDNELTLQHAQLRAGLEVTKEEIPRVAARVWQLYQQRGYPDAQVSGQILELETPLRVTILLSVHPGRAQRIKTRRFKFDNPSAELRLLKADYALGKGARADKHELARADETFEAQLQESGWHNAQVTHQLVQVATGNDVTLVVRVTEGPKIRMRFEGNRTFDSALLLETLDLQNRSDRKLNSLASQIRQFYVDRGFLDAQVKIQELNGKGSLDALLSIREGRRVRVVARTYPCLDGIHTAKELDKELDGFLSEQSPDADKLLTSINARTVEPQLVPHSAARRTTPFRPEATQAYAPELYSKALTHLRALYRSEGYLSAQVGPVALLRRRCAKGSQPGQCRPLGQRIAPIVRCPAATSSLSPLTLQPQESCIGDPRKGVYCENKVVLSIPVKAGPRTTLWDVQFTGNRKLLETELNHSAGLTLGTPVSQIQLQQARRRILDQYGDRGFAFASVEVDLQLSQDQTRGRARFIIGEREEVHVKGFVVRGAKKTSHGLILSRLELERGGLFRISLARESEEQLATLGVFSSVTISLEDPDVPAREKLVVISVQELPSQYVDVRPGVSTGEGIRARFEYGHRNLGGRAIQARVQVQLGYLPDAFIVDPQVRARFLALSPTQRLERRNTLTLAFPIAKRYRLSLDGVDARDNSRDFGITKQAALVTVDYRPTRRLSLLAGTSVELNDARIFGETQTLKTYLEANPQLVRLLNVPEGRSVAVALRAAGTWDATDNPLGPTRGLRLASEAEPVFAFLDDNSAAIDLDRCQEAGQDSASCEFKSRFLKVSQRISGYIPLNDGGLSLALSLRWGANFQLVNNSSTYPDRLFFFGGGDSLRGFLQASVIPQDIAERLSKESDDAGLSASDVVIRGGDFVLNPRAELRIPLTKLFHTALFVDTGNVWRDIANVDPTVLRYTAGTGLRAITPIGPLAFDYGIKLDPRFYESSFGAFHFSVGLF